MGVRFHRPSTRVSVGLGVLSMLLLAGCGPATPPSATSAPKAAAALQPQEALKQRVEARWARLIERDFAGAYTFETPAYRATVDRKQYGTQFGVGVNWVRATVDQVRVDPAGDRAEVDVTLQMQSLAPLGAGLVDRIQPLRERWILTQGDWWVVRDDD